MSSYNHPGCSYCGGPFNGGNCLSCSSVEFGNEFVYDPNPYSYNETPNFFNQPPHHQYETYSCEFCGGNSHSGFDCQTWNTPVFDQGPYYNQDFGFNQPLHYSPSQPQQYLCCEICGNDAHYGYDCPPQVPFVYNQDPCYNQNYDEFPQTLPKLLSKLVQDWQSINEELAEYINTPSWNLPTSSYDDDDDEESSIPLKDIIISGLPPCVAITPVLFTEEPVDSLIMEDEHLDTIPETKSDEFIKSSVENLVQNPSESEEMNVLGIGSD
ncbi:hypothetical protein Tco_1162340 [Tanacetum coccineum]